MNFSFVLIFGLLAPALSHIVDKCVIEPSNTAAIELVASYQSQLINKFALDAETKLEVLQSTEKVSTKNQKIVFKVTSNDNSTFFIGAEFQIKDGNTEILEFYQAKNLTKVAEFFDLEVQDKPIFCPEFKNEFVKFSDAYFTSISPALSAKVSNSAAVTINLGHSDKDDVQGIGFKFVPMTSIKTVGGGTAAAASNVASSARVESQATVSQSASAASAVSQATTQTTTQTQVITGGGVVGTVPGADITATAQSPEASKTAKMSYIISGTDSNVIPILLEETDKVIVDYVAKNFRLAYGFRIFKPNGINVKSDLMAGAVTLGTNTATKVATPVTPIQERVKRRLNKNRQEKHDRRSHHHADYD